MTPRSFRLIAVCLSLLGQAAGAFGLPAVRGSAHGPDAACGCCPADRTAGRCCCTHGPDTSCCSKPDEELAPCCRGKKPESPRVVWVVPALQSKCLGPNDTVPGSVVPASIPPGPLVGWTVTTAATLSTPIPVLELTSRDVPPDDPPPRAV